MTPEAMRVVIAEECGIRLGQYYCSVCRECVPIETVTSGGYHEKCGGVASRDIPNYPEDLNACAEMRKCVPPGRWYEFKRVLRMVTLRDGLEGSDLEDRLINSTAPQHCESFLRAIGKWVEE